RGHRSISERAEREQSLGSARQSRRRVAGAELKAPEHRECEVLARLADERDVELLAHDAVAGLRFGGTEVVLHHDRRVMCVSRFGIGVVLGRGRNSPCPYWQPHSTRIAVSISDWIPAAITAVRASYRPGPARRPCRIP